MLNYEMISELIDSGKLLLDVTDKGFEVLKTADEKFVENMNKYDAPFSELDKARMLSISNDTSLGALEKEEAYRRLNSDMLLRRKINLDELELNRRRYLSAGFWVITSLFGNPLGALCAFGALGGVEYLQIGKR